MIRVAVDVPVMVRVSNLLGSDYGQGEFRVIIRVRAKLELWLGLKFDPNNLLTLTIIIIIIRQPLCPVVGRRPLHAVSKLPCLVLSSAISCHSSIFLGCLSIAWLISLVVFSCHII